MSNKCITLSSFTEFGLESLFVHMGWKEFLEINEKYYPQLVQIFYANFSINQNSVIHTRVGDVDVFLSVDDLAHILALLNEGYDLYKEHLNSFEDYPKRESLELASILIHYDNNPRLTLNDKVSLLTLPCQILFRLSCSIFFLNLENMVKLKGVSLS